MKGIRIYHNKNGWIVETPISLSELQLKAAIKFHKDIVIQRIEHGARETRELYKTLLSELNEKTIRQKLITKYPWEQDKFLF